MRALVLDRTHHMLDGVPEIPVDGDRPLVTVRDALPFSVHAPAGSRACTTGGRDFVFVVDRSVAPDRTWRPLREVSHDDALWGLYVTVMLGGYSPPTRAIDVWSFGDHPEMAAQLVHLVACGEKRVTMGWVDAARAENVPLAYLDGVSVVTDGFGYPRVVLRSTEVRIVPFGEIDSAAAAGEGEGDLTHADWRESHVRYFSSEAKKHGLVFDDRSQISVETFEVLHVVGAPAGTRTTP